MQSGNRTPEGYLDRFPGLKIVAGDRVEEDLG
jgi:hypothetical protein